MSLKPSKQAIHIPHHHLATTPPESFPPSPSIPPSTCTWHTLISNPLTPTTDSLYCGMAALPPKTGNLCPHRHLQSELYHVISGRAVATVNGTDFLLEKGSTLWIPGDAEHGVVNAGDEEFKWFYVFAVGGNGEVVYRWSGEGKRVKAKL